MPKKDRLRYIPVVVAIVACIAIWPVMELANGATAREKDAAAQQGHCVITLEEGNAGEITLGHIESQCHKLLECGTPVSLEKDGMIWGTLWFLTKEDMARPEQHTP